MAKKFLRKVLRSVSANTVTVEYPAGMKVTFREYEQGWRLVIRVDTEINREEK